MGKWIVLSAAAAALFVVACGGGNEASDENGQQDTIVADTTVVDNGAIDTNVGVDIQEDTAVAVDTNVGEDTAQPDTNVQVDEGQQPDTNAGCPEGATTGATCGAAGACAVLCDDASFQETCLASADQAAKDAYADFAGCLATAACANVFAAEQIDECVTDNCGPQVAACFVGTNTCREMWTCRTDCDPSDPACPMRCFASGTVEAQAAWITYKECIFGVECANEDVMENGWPTFTCEQNARGFCTIPYQSCFPPT